MNSYFSDVLPKLEHLNDVGQKMDAKLNHLTDNEKAEFSKLETGKPGKDDDLEGFQRVSNTQYIPVA